MRAIVIDQFGGEDQLKLANVPVPAPGPSEVLIRIHYTSVNPADWKAREGVFKDMMPHRFPLILGWDAAGVVEGVGVNVSRFHVGDKVFADCWKTEMGAGTYAEYVAMDESKVAKMPKNLDFREAATVPLAGLTAWQSLFDVAKLKAGETLLINGGAGGVGSFAIQFAKAKGAKHIFVTAHERHHSYLESIGADVIIDYSKRDVDSVLKEHEPDGVDVVLDLIGGETLHESYAHLKRGGRLVSTAGEPDAKMARERGVEATAMFAEGDGKQLAEIAKLIEQGKVKPPHIEEFDLADVRIAHKRSEGHHTEGKLVLKVH